MCNISYAPLKLIGETSFRHYGCITTASLYANDLSNPELVIVAPHSNKEELSEQIVFTKINHQWLTEYSLPVLHADTYKNIVETLLELITR